MKMNKKLLLLTVCLLLLSLVFSACGDKEITGIEIIEGLEREYSIGDTPDLSGVKAHINYNDGTYKEVTAEELTFSAIDTTSAGEKQLSVTYGGFTATFTVTVKGGSLDNQRRVESIEYLGSGITLTEGNTLDISGVTVKVNYDDGNSEVVNSGVLTFPNIADIDTSKAGTASLTVSYGGKETTIPVTINEAPKITGIIVDGDSINTELEVGGTLDLSNLKVYAVYSDGTQLLLNNTELSITQPDMSVEGDKELVIAYGEFEKTITISVDPPTLTGIEINPGSYPTKVIIGEAYSATTVSVTAHYSNGTTKQIQTGLTVGSIDTASAGEKELTVSYEGMSDSVTVTVLGISSLIVDASSIETKINLNAELDTSAIRVTAVYSDGSTSAPLTFTLADGVTVDAFDATVPGTHALTVHYKGATGTVNVTVRETNYTVFGVELPAPLTQFASNATRFKDSTAPYMVGDDNPFRLTLELTILNNNDELVEDFTSYVSLSKVYLVENGKETLLEGDALDAMVSIDEAKNTFDFTDAAIGKSFKLVTRPRYGVDESSASEMERSLTVLIVDGYNVTNVKELNLITNANSKDMKDLGKNKTQLEMVNTFLAEHNISRPAKMSGVVIHGNLNVTVADIPADYLHTYQGQDSFYDHFSVYYHEPTADNPSFAIYGNYFTINTKDLPTVCPKACCNDDDNSSSEVFRFRTAEVLWDKDHYLTFDHRDYVTDIVNLAMRDDDPNSNNQEESDRHRLGLIAFKVSFGEFNFTNTNIEAFMLGIVPEQDNLIVNLDKVKFYNAWQGHLFIWSNNAIQESIDKNAEPWQGYSPIEINITDSLLGKCGGPVILAQSPAGNMAYTCNKYSGGIITADDKSELYSYVTGQEAWFVAHGQSGTAKSLFDMSALFEYFGGQYGKPSGMTTIDYPGYEVSNEPMVNLVFVDMTGGKSTYTIAGTKVMDMADPTVGAYIGATGGYAPVFATSDGGYTYYDNTKDITGDGIADPALYSIDFETGAVGMPTVNVFEGDYLNIFFGGMGITVEYFH